LRRVNWWLSRDADLLTGVPQTTTPGARVWNFRYDGVGRLMLVERFSGGLLAETDRYYYDGVRRICEDSGASGADPAYVWGVGGVDDILAKVIALTNVYPYATDENGNVIGYGQFFEHQYAYTPYGEVLRRDLPASPHHQTIGHQGLFAYRLDGTSDAALEPGATVLYHNRNRWYSPSLGRFTSRDPNETTQPVLMSAYDGSAPFVGVSPPAIAQHYGDGLNLFAYLMSNPVNGRDPLGLFSLTDMGTTMGVQGLVGGLVSGAVRGAFGDGDFAQGFLWGAAGGALGGAAGYGVNAGLAFMSSYGVLGTLAGHMGVGAVDGAVAGFTESYLTSRDFVDALTDAAVGGAIGSATGGVLSLQQLRRMFVPAKVKGILAHLRAHNWSPPKGVKGGKAFYNKQGRLPRGGSYKEFDVDVKVQGQQRASGRIVVDMNTGSAWYTPDHYDTFIPIE
jgi:RHS repeat-associated protein